MDKVNYSEIKDKMAKGLFVYDDGDCFYVNGDTEEYFKADEFDYSYIFGKNAWENEQVTISLEEILSPELFDVYGIMDPMHPFEYMEKNNIRVLWFDLEELREYIGNSLPNFIKDGRVSLEELYKDISLHKLINLDIEDFYYKVNMNK